MTDAPTPLPHTPTVYLDAGGTAFFSADCQQHLIDAQLDPDDFGSYAYVRRRVRDAQQRVATWEAMTPAQQAAAPAARPTMEDMWRADCTAGHLMQDAVARAPQDGNPMRLKPRGDPCSNAIDGYVHDRAPCMPTQGTADDPNTVEGRVSQMERDDRLGQRRRNNEPRGQPEDVLQKYPKTDRQGHEDARVRQAVEAHRNADPLSSRPVQQGVAMQGLTVDQQITHLEQSRVAGKAPQAPTVPDDLVVNGDSAAECINNWRKNAENAMRTSGVDEEIDNLDRIANPRTAADRRAIRDERRTCAAEAAAQEAERVRQNNLANNTPGLTLAQRQAATQQAREAERRRDEAQRNVDRIDNAPAQLQCLRDQRARIKAGTQKENGTAFRLDPAEPASLDEPWGRR